MKLHFPIQQVPAPGQRNIEIDGVKKKVVSQQFNSPLNLYSDESIADAVIQNRTTSYGTTR